MFDQHANLQHKFPLREESLLPNPGPVTVSDYHQLFVLIEHYDGCQVEVYDTDGRFVHSFRQGLLKAVCGITTANDDMVMMLDYGSQCIRLFSAQ